MPELPEVEFAARQLRRWLVGRRVEEAEVDPTRITRPQPPGDVARAIAGHTLRDVQRRAKYLLLTFDHGVGVLSHLGMTGKWVIRGRGEPVRFSRARLFLPGGQVVHLCDSRMFGQLRAMPAEALRQVPVIKGLGPDPLEDGLTSKELGERLRRTARPVKLALMDQTVIAGLGNIHAAEALYRAKIHPARAARSLTAKEVAALRAGIFASIRHALAAEAQSRAGEITYVEEGGPNPFRVYDRKGEVCRRCGAEIDAFTQGGRTTYFCPGCQKKD